MITSRMNQVITPSSPLNQGILASVCIPAQGTPLVALAQRLIDHVLQMISVFFSSLNRYGMTLKRYGMTDWTYIFIKAIKPSWIRL